MSCAIVPLVADMQSGSGELGRSDCSWNQLSQ